MRWCATYLARRVHRLALSIETVSETAQKKSGHQGERKRRATAVQFKDTFCCSTFETNDNRIGDGANWDTEKGSGVKVQTRNANQPVKQYGEQDMR